MSVFKMTDKPRDLPWCYEGREAGHAKRTRRYFESKAKALEYQALRKRVNRDVTLGLAISVDDLKRYTVRHLIVSYMKNKPLTKHELDLPSSVPGMPENVRLVLNSFLERDISNLSIVKFNKRVAEQYKDDRLKETTKHGNQVSPRTVKWELSKIQQAWKAAGKWYPELEALPNPFEGMRVKGSTGGRRERSLEEGELEKLIEACKRCLGHNQYYVPLAIYIAVDTGMRRQEIFNLTWEDIDYDRRRIKILKSKTDKATGNKGAEIVLPIDTAERLSNLYSSLYHKGHLPNFPKIVGDKPKPEDVIFPMTGETFKQSFVDVVRRASLYKNLTFHDLRRTANTTFYLAGLSKEERDLMLRHENKSMDSRYLGNVLLKQIQDKLERHALKGKTLKEHEKDMDSFVEAKIKEGLDKGISFEQMVIVMQAVYGNAKGTLPNWIQKRLDTIKTSPPN